MTEKDKKYIDSQIISLTELAKLQQKEIKLLKDSILELISRVESLESKNNFNKRRL